MRLSGGGLAQPCAEGTGALGGGRGGSGAGKTGEALWFSAAAQPPQEIGDTASGQPSARPPPPPPYQQHRQKHLQPASENSPVSRFSAVGPLLCPVSFFPVSGPSGLAQMPPGRPTGNTD